MSPGLKLYLDCIVFIFGAVVGSFLNVCVHRMPRGRSIVRPPSHCPKCKEPIQWFDNIPILSYVILRGRCRNCAVRISPRYALVELVTGLFFLAVWLKFTGWLIPIFWLFIAGLLVATFIDFEHYIIPDEITLGGCVAGLVLATAFPPLVGETVWYLGLVWSFVGLLVGGLSVWAIVEVGKLAFGRRKVPLELGTVVTIADKQLTVQDEVVKWEELFMRDSDRIRFRAATLTFADKTLADVDVRVSETHLYLGEEQFELTTVGPIRATTDLLILPQEAMGFGDVKLMAGIGAFLGWKPALFTLMVSSLLGSVVGLGLIILRLREMRGRIPYGPYIAAAAVLWVFYGRELVDWYMRLLIKE